jgi:DNA-binding beta-propeller fold protein YncE
MPNTFLTSVHPRSAIEGGRVAILGTGFEVGGPSLPTARIGDRPARVVFASPTRLDVRVPPGLTEAPPLPVRVDGALDELLLDVATPAATGLHQVDSPVIDRHGNLYVTYSGTRGQQVPVSIFRIAPNGTRETFSSGIVNPTSMAFDRDGRLFVSSRFEGTVYRLSDDGIAESFATDLGIACGLAFAPDGTLFVGDRSGTIFAVDRFGHATALATLPSSVAAFHLALGPDALYVSAPTLAPNDAVYRVEFDGRVGVYSRAFGRPQGLVVSPEGTLFVVEALAGASGLYRVPELGPPTLVLAGSGLVGVAFDGSGGMVVCTNDAAYRVPRPS